MKISPLKAITFLCVLSIPFLNAFSLSEKIILPIFIYGVLTFFLWPYFRYKGYDIFYFCFVINLALAAIYNKYVNTSSILYILSFLTLFFIFVKPTRLLYAKHKNRFYDYLLICVMASSVYIIYEFLALNFFQEFFIELPRARAKDYDARFLKLFRPRGFAEESGHMSMFYEFAIPLLLPKIRSIPRGKKFFVVSTIVVAVLLLGSSFTMFIGLIFFLVYFITMMFQSAKRLIILGTITLVLLSFVSLNSFTRDYFEKYYNAILNKISLTETNRSVSDRTYRLTNGIDFILEHPITGLGPMKMENYMDKASTLNLFLDIWISSGILGLLFFLGYYFSVVIKFCQGLNKNNLGVLISLLLVSLHYCIITNFWFPFLWVLFGIMEAEISITEKISNENIAYNK